MRLSLTKPVKTKPEVFYAKWIVFIVSFFKEISKAEVEQLVFNLWSEDSEKLVADLITNQKLLCENNMLKVGPKSSDKETYQGANFRTCPVMEGERTLKDLWTIGDDLAKQIKKSDVSKLLTEFANSEDLGGEITFQTTSAAKNYFVQIDPYSRTSRYVRFFSYGKNS